MGPFWPSSRIDNSPETNVSLREHWRSLLDVRSAGSIASVGVIGPVISPSIGLATSKWRRLVQSTDPTGGQTGRHRC
jgi:hypothetical protein